MTIVTGTSDFQQLFQGLLAETAIVEGEVYAVPIVKLTADSNVGGGGAAGAVTVNNFPSTQVISGTVSVNNLPQTQVVSGTVFVGNFPSPQIVSGSVLSLDFPTYGEWDYFGNTIYSGTNLYRCVFRRGGVSGTVIATINMTYDGSDNLLTVSKT